MSIALRHSVFCLIRAEQGSADAIVLSSSVEICAEKLCS